MSPREGADTRSRLASIARAANHEPATLPVLASPSPRRTLILPIGSGGGIIALTTSPGQDRPKFGPSGPCAVGMAQLAMTVFGPPLVRLPMIWPPPPLGSVTRSETVAFGQAVPAAVSSASPGAFLPAASRLFITPPLSWASIETD